jgi:hypothetical protein
MKNNSTAGRTFTSLQAAYRFLTETGFYLHPTVPGTLLARAGVQKIDSKSRPAKYDSQYWSLAWELMIDLAQQRCKHDPNLQPPRSAGIASNFQAKFETIETPKSDGAKANQRPQKPVASTELRRHPTRRFIEVPFGEKDLAKDLGARWEPQVRKWYVPTGIKRRLFRWPDALLPPELCAISFSSEKAIKPLRRSKTLGANRSVVSSDKINKVLDERLAFLLDKLD